MLDKIHTQDKMAERARFEQWYTTHACNYSRDPIGSRDCSMQWEAWDAALQAQVAEAARAAEPGAVTDEMVERACKKYAFREDGAAFPDAYSEEEVLAERVLMREFLEHVLRAAQPAQDAKDGARYRFLADHQDADLYMENPGKELLDRAIDAAMAKESGR